MKYFERRVCTFTKQPIELKDRASVQLVLAKLDLNGRATGETEIVDICSLIRKTGEADSLLTEYSKYH